MEIISIKDTKESIVLQKVVEVLSSGGLVIYPTETTYGIGADATNVKAVQKLLCYKKRREGKPLSIAVSDIHMASNYVEVNEQAKHIYETFLPGPVTVVSAGKHKVAPGVESELGTLGVRIPSYDLVINIVKTYGKPITATGANASYKKRPYSVEDIFNNISSKQKELIDLVLDAGQLPHNEPSTVIDTTLNEVSVLRQGSVSFTEKNEVITHDEIETQELGKKVIQKYKNILSYKAIVICLEGELGAGKTQFSKGVAKGLGVKAPIVSPTFTLSRNYPFEGEGKMLEFVHIDTWRMFDAGELEMLGFQNSIDNCHVIVIEWANKMLEFIKQYSDEAKIIWVKFSYGKKENDRIITYSDVPFSS